MSMRGFIDILNESILLERQDYEEMFTKYLQIVQDVHGDYYADRAVTTTKERINAARKVLKRQDRIVWYLRWLRLKNVHFMLLTSATQAKPILGPERKQVQIFYDSLVRDFARNGVNINTQTMNDLSRELAIFDDLASHIFNIGIPAIDNYQFHYQTVDTVIRDFQKIETEWKETRTRLIPMDDPNERPVISFPDGYAWVDLGKGVCRREGDAMGHCGNAAETSLPGDRIFSLRKIVKVGQEKHWQPSLTFIVDKDGFLGESKGRGNDKPAAHYHPYILALLRSPYIKGIKGGGYLPEYNFKLSDLTEQERKELYEKKPSLAPIPWKFAKTGMTKELADEITKTISSNIPCIGFSPDFKYFRVYAFSNWHEIIVEHGDKKSIRLLEMVSDGNVDFPRSGDEAQYFWHDLPIKLQRKIASYIKETSDVDEEEYDFDHLNDVWQYIVNNDHEILNCFEIASEAGYYDGTIKSMENTLINSLRNGVEITGEKATLSVEFDNPTNQVEWGNCWLSITQKELIKILSNEDDMDKIFEDGWLQYRCTFKIGNDDYDHYDKTAAIERFYEEIPALREE